MEINKEAAEQCRDRGATELKRGDYPKAIKFLKKSLSLYPLPGVEALLASAERSAASAAASSSDATAGGGTSSSSSSTPRQQQQQRSSSSASSSTSFNHNASSSTTTTSASASASATSGTGDDGRSYTHAQVQIVETVLKAKEGGRGAHYRVLSLQQTCTESEIKKSYRKLALKLHPDKNSAPKADEAFKAVGLAYATLSDPQKRTIYDRYGEEDPDNRGGGMGGMRPGRGGGVHFRPGQEVSPEDIFNMFFGGGMAGPGGGMGGMHRGPGGMHFYTNFGGMPGGFAQQQQQRRRRAAAGGGPQQQDDLAGQGIASLMQLLPFLMIMLLTFYNMGNQDMDPSNASRGKGKSPGLNKYFTLEKKDPFVNPMYTRLTTVKDIPYWLDSSVYRKVVRDRYQLAQVERMVQTSYEQFLVDECTKEKKIRRTLLEEANNKPTEEEKESAKRIATKYELSRCIELNDLFPIRHSGGQRKR